MKQSTPPVQNVDLVRACSEAGVKISSAAVAKWFTSPKPPEYLKPQYLFAVARRCGVDAEWLATGKLDAYPKKKAGELEVKDRALIDAYKRLPSEVRMPIRSLIDVLAVAGSDSYAKWSKQMGDHAKARDLAVHDSDD